MTRPRGGGGVGRGREGWGGVGATQGWAERGRREEKQMTSEGRQARAGADEQKDKCMITISCENVEYL